VIGEGLVLEVEAEGFAQTAQGLLYAPTLARDLDLEAAGDAPGRLVGDGCESPVLEATAGCSRPGGLRRVGAKLGAIPCGSWRTAVDADGLESPTLRPEWNPVDAYGLGLEIYGSGGWGFESLRAC
jgi:hypothetical protein